MNSTKDLLHRIADKDLTRDQQAQLRCKLSAQLKEGGHYEAAREALGQFWQGVDERPLLHELSQQTAAEVLLRVGALTSDIGSASQIEGAQDAAKDFLSESLSLFESLRLKEKAAEAKTELAFCYWRQGAFDDARIILHEARTQLVDSDNNELKAVAMLRGALVEGSSKRFNDALRLYLEAEPIFEKTGSDVLKGKFHHGFGFVLRNLSEAEERHDYLDRALIEYAAASFYFNKAGLSRFQGCVENNLGFLFATIGNFREAHEHLDRAQAFVYYSPRPSPRRTSG